MLQKMAQHSNFQKLSDTAIIKKIYYIILPPQIGVFYDCLTISDGSRYR
jgi:hypothetical protein